MILSKKEFDGIMGELEVERDYSHKLEFYNRSLQDQANNLDDEVADLQAENTTLTAENALLKSEIAKLKDRACLACNRNNDVFVEEPEYYVEVPGSLGWYSYDASDGNLTIVPEMLYATAFTDNLIKQFGLEHCQRERK